MASGCTGEGARATIRVVVQLMRKQYRFSVEARAPSPVLVLSPK